MASGLELLRQDAACFSGSRKTDPDQTKALPDACLYVNPTYLDAPSSNFRPEMAKAMQEVITQDFSPLAAWEFKDIACATLPVMIAIREICQSTKIFQWVSCSEWGTKGPRCPSRGCVDADTRKWKVSGRCARFDSPILEEFVSRVAERKDVTCTAFINAVRPLKADYRTARCIIQQLWAELVTIEGTVGVINGGTMR
ncbi:hypothetical protein BDZ89DRAFT_546782 [Hymenopellis radicata]|nr:hypothetical protein BDZ89DRAFT_546782 [Hymenopellis radicata]